VAWFSRQREYRADSGAADLLGSQHSMVAALRRLGGLEPGELPKSIQAAGISDKPGFMALFSSHPPIEQRVAALQNWRPVILQIVAPSKAPANIRWRFCFGNRV
jgi:heat shock protein HtpX